MIKIVIMLLVLLVAGKLLLTQVEAGASKQANLPVNISWVSDGKVFRQAFNPGVNPWLSATTGATITVFWAADLSGVGDSFKFVPDGGSWSVGTRGDLNGNGVVDVFDVITLLQIIVGIGE